MSQTQLYYSLWVALHHYLILKTKSETIKLVVRKQSSFCYIKNQGYLHSLNVNLDLSNSLKSSFMFLVHHFKSATLSHLITKTLALTMSDFSTPVDDSKRYPQIMHKHSISWSFFRIRRRLYLPLYPLVQGAVDVVFLIVIVCHC